ncbi:MAG: hypothetical protein ACYTEX_22795 [Planctomycetota bacterium]|jgi:hypothetical protein
MPDLQRLNVTELAGILSAHWKPYTHEMVVMDCEEGAPLNEDGSVNFVRYACWLLGERSAATPPED